MPKPDGYLYRAASERPHLEPAVHEEVVGPWATTGSTVEQRGRPVADSCAGNGTAPFSHNPPSPIPAPTCTPGRPDRPTTVRSAAHA